MILTVPLAMWFGRLAGIYQASRESSFRRRALKLYGKNGQLEEFLIVSGDATIVEQLYEVVVATTKRAEEIAFEKAAENEPIGIANDEPK